MNAVGPYCTVCGYLHDGGLCECKQHDDGLHCTWCSWEVCRCPIGPYERERQKYLMSQNDGSQYDADYFIRGKESGKSLYQNYRWMPNLTRSMVVRIISHCGIRTEHSVLDFGCARGYTVRALREFGHNAWGYDISQWALENCDPEVKDYLIANDSTLLANSFDWVIAKDVLEHIPQVSDTITQLMDVAEVGVFVVVPLSDSDGGKYIVLDYEEDVTHIHRLTLATWARMFVRSGWTVTMSYRVPGVKDNYRHHEKGNGFITARRI